VLVADVLVDELDCSIIKEWFYFDEAAPLFDEAEVALVISLPNSLGFRATLLPTVPSVDFLLFSLLFAT